MLPMRTTPPFRADHVGSLLRPQVLLAARDDFAAGKIDAARLREIEDQAITDAVAMQAGVGLQSAPDGGLRRASGHLDFISEIGGQGKYCWVRTVQLPHTAAASHSRPSRR